MADLCCEYLLETDDGDITFNEGDLFDDGDKYWITNITGLDQAPLRTPQDFVPFGDGGLVYNFWKGSRHPVFEGVLITGSEGFASLGQAVTIVQNTLEEDLITALESIIRADGTLSWTPTGGSPRSLTVRSEVPVEFTATDDYLMKHFVFGLVAANPDW
jgi:hypothetical protein